MNLTRPRHLANVFLATALLAMVTFTRDWSVAPAQAVPAAQSTDPGAPTTPATGVETIVFLRHGEKPPHGLGQLTPQGLNRAIALSTVLPSKFGKPDFLFAPDPGEKNSDGGVPYNYIRPLATIEPTAISLEMPVQTSFGYKQIDKLNEELSKPQYAKSTIFVAWEHGYENKAVTNLVKQFGGDPSQVPTWPGSDFDSLYVLKITRKIGQPATIIFTHDHEGLDHQSKAMPVPATQS